MKIPFNVECVGYGHASESPPYQFAVFADFACPLGEIASIETGDFEATGKVIVSLKSKPDDFFYATPIKS